MTKIALALAAALLTTPAMARDAQGNFYGCLMKSARDVQKANGVIDSDLTLTRFQTKCMVPIMNYVSLVGAEKAASFSAYSLHAAQQRNEDLQAFDDATYTEFWRSDDD